MESRKPDFLLLHSEQGIHIPVPLGNRVYASCPPSLLLIFITVRMISYTVTTAPPFNPVPAISTFCQKTMIYHLLTKFTSISDCGKGKEKARIQGARYHRARGPRNCKCRSGEGGRAPGRAPATQQLTRRDDKMQVRLTVDLHSCPWQTHQSHPSAASTVASAGSPISLASRLWQTDGSQS